ncbi:MAG: hypothetical protein J1G05_05720 [Clostridiales bacterium]|nr:hypothetical protein [Clostridiales bacterium]
MITEYGSILTEKTTVGEARKARTKNLLWLWIVLLIIGSIGVAVYIVGTVLQEIYPDDFKWADAFIFAAVPFALGLIFTLATRIQKKDDLKTDGLITNSEFFSDCIIFRSFKGDEQISVIRINYLQIVLTKKRSNFLYVLVTQGVYYPIFVGGLSQTELNTLDRCLKLHVYNQLKLPVPETTDTIELKPCELLN